MRHFSRSAEPQCSAVLGKAGKLISFRVSAMNAPHFTRLFQPTFDMEQLLNLPNHAIYLRLMIDKSPNPHCSDMTACLRPDTVNATRQDY